MKRLKQIKESKDMILKAFMALLEHGSYDQVSVSQIALEAGVTRMTLYRHFKEKEDILLYHFEQNLERVLDHMEESTSRAIEDLLEFRFKVLKESKYTSILAKHKKLDKLTQTIGLKFIHYFDAVLPGDMEDYSRAFITGGIDAMTILWIDRGMKESPQFMAGKVLKAYQVLVDKSLRCSGK